MMHNVSLLGFCEPQQHLDAASQLHAESLVSLCIIPKLLRLLSAC